MPLTCIELFAGAGGLALGLEKAGFEALALEEIDKDASQTLMLNCDFCEGMAVFAEHSCVHLVIEVSDCVFFVHRLMPQLQVCTHDFLRLFAKNLGGLEQFRVSRSC